MDRQTPEYFAKVDLENERHYRSLAAESRDSVNVALFTEKANFYAHRALRILAPTRPAPGHTRRQWCDCATTHGDGDDD